MAETPKPMPVVRTFLTDLPTVTATAASALVNRRANAVLDSWRSVLEVREPTDLVAAQLAYWRRLVDDYQDAYAAGLSQLTAPCPAPEPAAPAAVAEVVQSA